MSEKRATATSVAPEPKRLIANLLDARERTLALVADLDDRQLMGPRLPIVNPLLWEIGHVAWFQEYWILRHARQRQPVKAGVDALYDSSKIAHDTRWDLPLPSRSETVDYMARVLDEVVDGLKRNVMGENEAYFVQLATFHEDMHDEAFTYTRQTLGYSPPEMTGRDARLEMEQACGAGADVQIPGGRYQIGSSPDDGFIFDNEKWSHEVEVGPFSIAEEPVTNSQFARFVEAGGYTDRRNWSDPGWGWRAGSDAEHPVYWRAAGSGWECRAFDRWVSLREQQPIIHVNWFEAEAYCNWAGRRLPSECEREVAAARGLRLTGNAWEWTSSVFEPYPGFSPDPYRGYSEPWFSTHMVLRGGGWATRARMIRRTYRNFYMPDRRDVFAGFRTCAR